MSATHSRRTGSRSTWMRWGSSRFRQALSSPPPRRSPSPLMHRQVRPPRSPAIRLFPSSTSPRTRRDRPPHRIFHRTTTVTAATEAENRVGITPVTYCPADQGDHLERPCTDSARLSRRALSSPATSGAGESMVSHEPACPPASLPAHAGSLPDLDTRPECTGTASHPHSWMTVLVTATAPLRPAPSVPVHAPAPAQSRARRTVQDDASRTPPPAATAHWSEEECPSRPGCDRPDRSQ